MSKPTLAELADMLSDEERDRIIAEVLADALADIPAMFDEAAKRHRASGLPTITREEADRRADEAMAKAMRAFRGGSP